MFFGECGQISSVRLVRDSQTGIGKGFGYVNFKNKDGVVLALEKNGQTFNGREIRVMPYKYNLNEKPSKGKKGITSKFQKQSNSSVSTKRGKPGKSNQIEAKAKPKMKKPTDFKGEVASKKKLSKKSLKNRIKSSKMNKQKKKIAEILSK